MHINPLNDFREQPGNRDTRENNKGQVAPGRCCLSKGCIKKQPAAWRWGRGGGLQAQLVLSRHFQL